MKRMLTAALAVVLAAAQGAWGAETWTYAATANFEVYTTAGAGAAKDALKRFELIREFFAQSLGLSPQTAAPVRLIAFGSEKEFLPYKPSEAAAAFYLPGLDRDYIVVGDVDANLWPIAAHEYVHLLMKYSGVKAPLWLNEGTAELYSTMTQVADYMRVGVAPAHHLLTVRQGRPIPLEEFFAVDHESERYTTKRHAGMFYSQSWALTHMLFLDRRYMTARPAFMNAVLAGAPPVEAFGKVYAKTPQQVYRDLEGYVRQSSYLAANYPFKPPRDLGRAEPRELEGMEARLVTAELLASMPSKKAGAGEAVAALLQGAAGDARWAAKAHETAAFFAWREGNNEKALEHFEKAVAAGSESARVYADYAMLLGGRELAKSEQLLLKARELRPDWVETRVRLADVYARQRKFGAALSTILEIKRVRPAEAFNLFQVSAQAYAGLSQWKDAKTALDKAEQYADSESRKLYVSRLRSYVEHAEQRAELAKAVGATERQVAVEVRETEEDGERPPVMRREVRADGEVVEQPAQMSDEEFRMRLVKQQGEGVRGEFVELNCEGEKPVVVVESQGRPWRFRVDDFGEVVVTGVGGSSVELTCGAQKKQKITVRFGQTAVSGLDGIVKGLSFE